MGEPSKSLSSIPRRFWTEAVARLALAQGDHALALEMVRALHEDAQPGGAASLDELLSDAEAAVASAQARAGKERTIERLQGCLRRARALRRARSTT